MSLVNEFVQSWRAPRQLMRDMLARGQREDRALARIMGASVLIFLAQWPVILRHAQTDASVPFDARIGAALFATMFLVPLCAYALGFLSHIIARLLRGRGTWFGARLALFNALLFSAPLMLLHGALAGFWGQTLAVSLFGLAVFAGFLYVWIMMLIEVET